MAQYIVPACLLVGALVSIIRRRRQSVVHALVAADRSSNALEKMNWREFEGLVAETFRQQGYRVVERGGDGPDGGVDLELYQGTDKYLVQCKQWKSSKVALAIVRELFGLMSAKHAVGGFVVASGDFTQEPKAFAEGRSIRLVDARKLRVLIATNAATTIAPKSEPPRSAGSMPDASPACPKCGSPMVQRVAKSGAKAGKTFWGARHFPPVEAFDPSGAVSARRSLAEFPHSLRHLLGSRNDLSSRLGRNATTWRAVTITTSPA